MKNGSQISSPQCAILSAKMQKTPLSGILLLCLLVAVAISPPSLSVAAQRPHQRDSATISPAQQEHSFIQALIAGAREEVRRKPLYKSAYYAGGFPPETEGVCTDLLWRAFAFAGYDLKKRMDADIRKHTTAYPRISKPDPNIDFRRVPNQTVFFRRHAETLTTRIDTANMAAWQPGNIVVFTNPDHIAILSDKRNAKGFPLLLHNQGPFATEEDDFAAWYSQGIVAHFRFIPQGLE